MAATFIRAVDPISEGITRLNNYPNCARATCIPFNGVIVGTLKPLVLPVISALGMVLFPIMAGYHSYRGNHAEAKNYFHAWQISVLVTAACFAFLMFTGFVTPPKIAIGLMAGVMACSIAFHVYRTEAALH